jgi:hypothetical protein
VKRESRSPLLYMAVGTVSDTPSCVAGKVCGCLWMNSGTVIIDIDICLLPINMGFIYF